jgi:predicted ATP-grasp superfamily ATP-dependent carboligase
LRALIVDSNGGRGALAAVRGLARAGWTVGVACPKRTDLPTLSRFAGHWHRLPALADGEQAFVQAIRDATATHRYELVFGCSDAEVLTLAARRHSVGTRVPYPAHEAVLAAIDKTRLAEAASSVSIATPPTVSSVADAHERWGTGPVVVKESQHGTRDVQERLSHVAPQRFDDPHAAQERVREIHASGGIALVQPMLDGELMAFSCVMDEKGEMLGRVQQIAERTYPLDAGSSARARTVAIDERLSERVSALLKALKWFGLVELQFLAGRDGTQTLLDFNGRFYGSLALALAAGVNLPDLWARAALGLMLPARQDARAGVRYQWLEGDLKAARERSRGRATDVADCLRYALLSKASIWSPVDPYPGLRAAGAVLRGATASILAGAAGGRRMPGAANTRKATDTLASKGAHLR